MSFERAMPVVFRWEGGYVDHPKDPGGATNFGITHQSLAAWRKQPVTKADVRALTKEEAAQIYRARFWAPVRGDDLPVGVDLVTFDAAVNSGPARGARWTQAAARVAQDGWIGPLTLAALRTMDAASIIKDATDRRLSFVQSLRTWSTFGRGWARRIGDIRATALSWAGQQPSQIRSDALAQETKAKKDAGGAAATGAGGAGSGGAAVVEPSGDPQILVLVVVAIALIAAAVFLASRARARNIVAEQMMVTATRIERNG